MGGQFGVFDQELLTKPLKDIDEFYIAWYLFSLSKSFNIVVGLFQIMAAILIVINRTALIGALLLLPILGQIFLIDAAFTTGIFGFALPIRLGGMLFCAILIIGYYKNQLKEAL